MTKVFRDNILYLTIALAVVGGLCLLFWYEDAHSLPIRLPFSGREAIFAATTLIVFGYAIKACRRVWHSPRFWLALGAILLVYIPLEWRLIEYMRPNVVFYALAAGLQLFILLVILDWILPNTGSDA